MKTAELSGAALDWAVALIEFPEPDYENDDRLVYVHGDDEFHFTPSTDWAQGGPIIEREGMQLWKGGAWCASLDQSFNPPNFETGETPLMAAMRCYVASKLGDEVALPDGVMPC